MIIGNQRAVIALTQQFPSVALLAGPPSVGKWAAAEHARRAYGIDGVDVLRIRRLGVTEARDLGNFSQRAPVRSAGRCAIVSLDSATPAALNALLKPLEEVGPTMHFLLLASDHIPETIATRVQVRYDFGLLSQDEVSEVLQTTRSLSAVAALRAAQASGGQISRAIDSMVSTDDKNLVLTAVRALRDRTADKLEDLATAWREEHTVLLVSWAQEAASGRWRIFSSAESGEVARSLPLKVLMALTHEVRPRFVIRSLLMDVLLKEER